MNRMSFLFVATSIAVFSALPAANAQECDFNGEEFTEGVILNGAVCTGGKWVASLGDTPPHAACLFNGSLFSYGAKMPNGEKHCNNRGVWE